MSVYDIIDRTIGKEGGYSNHPSDTGGATKWGITEAVARRHGYVGDMKVYPREMAVAVYLADYWVAPGFSKVATISEPIAEKLFDIGVNMGVSWAGIFLQQALNGFNDQARFYPDIAEDGAVGPGTRAALSAYLGKRGAGGEHVMLEALNILQGARYFSITRARAANEDFLYGWIANRISI